MARTELYGLLHVDEARIPEARDLPFLGLCFADEDGNVTVRRQSLNEIGVLASRYDAHERLWTFQLDLHDDDLPNADTEPAESFLKKLPLIGEHGMLVAREGWMDTPNWFLLVKDRNVIARQIVEHAEEDPGFVSLDDATALVQSLAWPAGAAFFESLKSRASK